MTWNGTACSDCFQRRSVGTLRPRRVIDHGDGGLLWLGRQNAGGFHTNLSVVTCQPKRSPL